MKSFKLIFMAAGGFIVCLYFVRQFMFSDSFSTNKIRENIVVNAFQDSLKNVHSQALPDVSAHLLKHKNQTENFMAEIQSKYGPIQYSSIVKRDTQLTQKENDRMKKCIQNAKRDMGRSNANFWGKNEHIRTKNHTYLNNKDAVLLEVGGNQGNDATRFVNLFNPRFIVLEPLEEYANILKNKFKNNSRVTVVNLGLGEKTDIVMVKIEGNNACATSRFTGAGGETPLFIVNATEFLLKLGLGMFDLDLMTLNCEGCEFEVLESILSSSLVDHFRNIQFATHSTIKGLRDPNGRYCRIQELLSRTHRVIYQYKLIWESWRRKDLP